MYKQTEEKYKKVKMGFGDGSIYAYGCYLVSLCNALNLQGYSFTPESLNTFFKDKNLWTGEFKNYIDVDNLTKVLPKIFSSFTRVEPFTDKQLKEYTDKKLFIVAKVSAIAIGGTGTHFVLVTKYDGKVATIFDPWFGDEQLVTKRYSKYGNLLGLRVFGILPYKTVTPENNNMSANLIDLKADINSAVENELGLKEYSWYNKNWSLTDMVKFFADYFSKTEKTAKDNETKMKAINVQVAKLEVSASNFESVASRLNTENNQLKAQITELSKPKNASVESIKEIGRMSWSGLVSILLTEGVLQNLIVSLGGTRLDPELQVALITTLTLGISGLDKYLHTRSKEYDSAIIKGLTPAKIWEMFGK